MNFSFTNCAISTTRNSWWRKLEKCSTSDAALIVAAQRIEHYEIAGYGSVRTFARILNYDDAARLLETTLKEESRTDERLTRLAERLNQKAEAADQSSA
ncbi:MAG TPA: DUF892 family protein [Opitutus sp.]|nr:DUF892 family protein [Opitutus sp.]